MILAVTLLLVTIHFPMWGGMLTRGNPDISEEDYYRFVGRGPCCCCTTLHCAALCSGAAC